MKKIILIIAIVALFAAIVGAIRLNLLQKYFSQSNGGKTPTSTEGVMDAESAGDLQADPNLTTAKAESGLPGTWQSVEDPKYVLAFEAGGKMTEKYDGKVTDTGSWKVLSSVSATGLTDVPENLGSGIALEIDREAPYYYSIITLDTDSLAMFYLPRGNVLTFTRIQ